MTTKSVKDSPALARREERLHRDLDHDGERGEPAAHVQQVLTVSKAKAKQISKEKPAFLSKGKGKTGGAAQPPFPPFAKAAKAAKGAKGKPAKKDAPAAPAMKPAKKGK